MPLITTPFTISSLVTVSFSDESVSELTEILFFSMVSEISLAMVVVDELSLDTEPVLVTKLELDSELERPVLSASGCGEVGTFTHRLRRFSLSDRLARRGQTEHQQEHKKKPVWGFAEVWL